MRERLRTRALDYVVPLPSVEECVERVAMRRGHGFTDEASTLAMHAQFAGADIAKRPVLRSLPIDLAQSLELLQAARDRAEFAYPGR